MAHRVTLIPGDGTGPELTEATRRVLEATGVEFEWDVQPAGADVDGRATAATRCPKRRSTRSAATASRSRGRSRPRSARASARSTSALRSAARPLRAGAAVQDLPGRAHPLRGRRPRDRPRDDRGHLRRDRVRAGHARGRGADRLARGARRQAPPAATRGISIKPISITGTRRVFEFAFDYARADGPRARSPPCTRRTS